MFSARAVLAVPVLVVQLMSPAPAARGTAASRYAAAVPVTVTRAGTREMAGDMAGNVVRNLAVGGGGTRTTAAVWPLTPRPQVVRGFSPPVHAWEAGHRGVDLLGTPGQVVRAAVAGVVTFAGPIAGRGVVVVTSGAFRTTYEPLAVSVSRGDGVHAGSPIGHLDLVGSHCLPRGCLHWGLIDGTTYRDPLTLLGARPVRLLPLYSALPVPDQARGWAWW
jgi:murein DD-endopeptidase MepM/ murein hydrolase activator NlpD